MEKRCEDYVGITCVNGHCPVANYNHYIEIGQPDLAEHFDNVKCQECGYYRGCEDCALNGTKHCDKKK